MSYINLNDIKVENRKITTLLYCKPGEGKSTAVGLIAEKSAGKTLVLDVDHTIYNTLAKREIVKDLSKIDLREINTRDAWNDWTNAVVELVELKKQGKLEYDTIAVDNVSELERSILANLGREGKNKGVPSMADYQIMQFRIMDSLRALKNLGVNVVLTAWEETKDIIYPDGTTYTMLYPKISNKIVDNVCGLCDVVGKIIAKQDGTRGIVLEATQNIYAKNQIDTRKGCKVEEYINL